MRAQVIELTIEFKYEWSALNRSDLQHIVRAIGKDAKRAKYTRHTVSFLVVTRETCDALMKRLAPRLEVMSFVTNWWANTIGMNAVSKNGDLCPFMARFKEAWVEADRLNKWSQPHDLRQVRPGDVFVNHGVDQLDREAAVKMRLGLSRQGQSRSNPHDDQG
ncbi:hypothetical protein [Xanthobacter sediminis]